MAQSKIVKGSRSDKFVARFDYEKEERFKFDWKIANFSDVYATAKSSVAKEIFRYPFTAGRDMGCPSNWEFLVKINAQGGLAGELKFLGSYSCGAKHLLFLNGGDEDDDWWKVVESWSTTFYPKQSDEPTEKTFRHLETLEEVQLQLQQGGFLSNDELQLRFRFKMSHEETRMSAAETELKRDLSWDFKNMLESGLGADVTFIFVEEEGSQNIIAKMKAHRLILSQRSSVFATMFRSGMKEAEDGEVRIEDMTPKSFGILLKYIYSGEVDGDWGSIAEELIDAAEKYDLKALQMFLCENIHSVLTVRNVWRIRELATLYNLPNVLKSTMDFIKDKTEAVVKNIHKVILKEED